MRTIFFLIFLTSIFSCDDFLCFKKKEKLLLDTIVDFSSVDSYPSFKTCDTIFKKQKKLDCFNATIHQKIENELLQHNFTVKDSIDEVVYVDVKISSNGIVSVDSIISSPKIKKQLPLLDSLLRVSVKKIPKLHPAIKRGVPVQTKHQLPLIIYVEAQEYF